MAKKAEQVHGEPVRISVSDVPELLAALRREMARLLRGKAASQEDNVVGYAVRKALTETADAFEAGLSSARDLDPKEAA